jgi:hypothetical protein
MQAWAPTVGSVAFTTLAFRFGILTSTPFFAGALVAAVIYGKGSSHTQWVGAELDRRHQARVANLTAQRNHLADPTGTVGIDATIEQARDVRADLGPPPPASPKGVRGALSVGWSNRRRIAVVGGATLLAATVLSRASDHQPAADPAPSPVSPPTDQTDDDLPDPGEPVTLDIDEVEIPVATPFADPTLIRQDDRLYAFGTSDGTHFVPMISSDDGGPTWSDPVDVLPNPPSTQRVWAPHVVELPDGRFRLYVTAEDPTSARQAIWVAESPDLHQEFVAHPEAILTMSLEEVRHLATVHRRSP